MIVAEGGWEVQWCSAERLPCCSKPIDTQTSFGIKKIFKQSHSDVCVFLSEREGLLPFYSSCLGHDSLKNIASKSIVAHVEQQGCYSL